MRFRLLLLIGLIFAVLAPNFAVTTAQENNPIYQFHQPTAEEYLTAIPEIVAQWEVETANLNTPLKDFYLPLVWELQTAFPLLVDADVRSVDLAYQSLVRNDMTGFDYTDRAFWNQQILLGELNQDDIELIDRQVLSIHNYTLEVTTRDFNADGQDEWLILAKRGNEYEQYLVFHAGKAHRYELVPTPLPWFGCCFAHYQTPSGGAEELLFQDINADGLPEWVVAFGGVGANNTNAGHLYVLEWREGKLINLAANALGYLAPAVTGHAILHPYVEWEFTNVDTDNELEIQQIQRYDDNWECTFYETRTYDWDGNESGYKIHSTDVEYEESWGCALRFAQTSFWEHDYPTALPLLELAIERADDEGTNNDLIQYATMRLALANALTGNIDEGAQLLSQLLTQAPQTELIRLWQRQLAGITDFSALALCQSLYTVAVYAEPYRTNIGFYGVTLDIGPQFYGGPRPDPIRAGCDFPYELEQALAESRFSVERPLFDQISALGITPTAVQTFDLNSDGNLEWLVWTEPLVAAILFAPIGGQYHVSRPNIRKPDSNTTLGTIELPNEAGLGLVNRYYESFSFDGIGLTPAAFEWPFQFACIPAREIPDPFNTATGFVRVWRLDVAVLQPVVDFWACEDHTTETYFPHGNAPLEVVGWIEAMPQDRLPSTWVPTTFTWSDDSLTYQPTPIDPTVINILLQPHERPPSYSDYDIIQVDIEDDAAINALISQMETVLAYYVEHNSSREIAEVRYWYALLLTLQGRTDEALTQYLEIVEELPDSSWSMMAMLHVEAVRD